MKFCRTLIYTVAGAEFIVLLLAVFLWMKGKITVNLDLPTGGVAGSKGGPKVIVDTDGGVDDGIALMILLSKNHLPAQVLAITTVAGNVGLENATQNILITLNVMNRTDIPVHMGASRSIVRGNMFDGYYGFDGFGDILPRDVPLDFLQTDAVDTIIRLVKKYPGEVSLFCVGPLTNIALAMRLYPPLLSEIKDIFIMGGNSTGGGEFNFASDAEAAHIVFQDTSLIRDKSYMLPFDPVQEMDVTLGWRKSVLKELNNSQTRLILEIEEYMLRQTGARDTDTWQQADPILAIMYVQAKELELQQSTDISSRIIHTSLSVATSPAEKRGMTTLHKNQAHVRMTTKINSAVCKSAFVNYFQ